MNVADLFLNVLVVFASVSFRSYSVLKVTACSLLEKKNRFFYACLNGPTVFKGYFAVLSRNPSCCDRVFCW